MYTFTNQLLTTFLPNNVGAFHGLAKLRKDCASARAGTTASKIVLIPDHMIKVIFGMVAAAGLNDWSPDIFGTPTSTYNMIHEAVAVKSFQYAVAGQAYLWVFAL